MSHGGLPYWFELLKVLMNGVWGLFLFVFEGSKGQGRNVVKGARGMPRLPEARKDAISCDKLRGLANTS